MLSCDLYLLFRDYATYHDILTIWTKNKFVLVCKSVLKLFSLSRLAQTPLHLIALYSQLTHFSQHQVKTEFIFF